MLAEHFGSIDALLNATTDELTSIEGSAQIPQKPS